MKQQDCHRLRQNARRLEARWQSSLSPAAIWPLVLAHPLLYAQLLHHPEKRQAVSHHSAKSSESAESVSLNSLLTQVESSWPGPKSQTWLELPVSWRAGEWLRSERYIPNKAMLAWEYQLQSTASGSELKLRLEYLVLPSEQASLQAGFKQIGQLIASQLEALAKQGRLALLPLGSAEWQRFTEAAGEIGRVASYELSLCGSLDPQRLSLQSHAELEDCQSWLKQAQQHNLLTASWESQTPDEQTGQSWSWPSEQPESQTLNLNQFGLRYQLKQTPTTDLPWSPLSQQIARLLFWPGQSRDWQIPEYLGAQTKLFWALDSQSTGHIHVKASGTAQTFEFSQPPARLKAAQIQMLNDSDQLQLLCISPAASGSARLPGTAQHLLTSPTGLSQLLQIWPLDQVCVFKGLVLQLSQPLPKGLRMGFQLRRGACLNPDSGLWMFSDLQAALDAAALLLGLLRDAQAAGLLKELPKIALAAGTGSLCRIAAGLKLEGELAIQLHHLLQLGLGSDLMLAGKLIQDPVCQTWIAHSRWLVSQAEGQNIFQLRPAR